MLTRFLRWLADRADPLPLTRVEEPEALPGRSSFFSTEISNNDLRTRGERMAALAARVLPRPTHRLVEVGGMDSMSHFAEDANNYENSLKAAFRLGEVGIPEVQAMWYGSQGFVGYQVCALMAQNWLVKKACLMPARDAIRRGYKFTRNDGDQLDPVVQDAIKRANKRFRLNRSLVEFVFFSRIFGIRIALTVVDSADPDYYVKPFNPDAIAPGTYKGMSQIDPYWCVPELTSNSAMNPAAIDFYEPTFWVCNGTRIHKSHLVISRGPEVADILKPSYLYGGLSVPQMIYERVYAAERTANEAPQLALTKRAVIFYTDAAKALAQQAQFEENLSIWARLRDNFGVKVADKDADKIEQQDTSLNDLDAVIMTQYQIVAAAANVPATKLLGTTPKGFNSTGDYETDSYHEELESVQTNDLEPFVDRHMVCLIRSEILPRFAVKPFDVECTWEPLATLSAKELADVNKVKAETDKALKDAGAIDGTDIRNRVSGDELSGHNGIPSLTDEDPIDADPQTA